MFFWRIVPDFSAAYEGLICLHNRDSNQGHRIRSVYKLPATINFILLPLRVTEEFSTIKPAKIKDAQGWYISTSRTGNGRTLFIVVLFCLGWVLLLHIFYTCSHIRLIVFLMHTGCVGATFAKCKYSNVIWFFNLSEIEMNCFFFFFDTASFLLALYLIHCTMIRIR